MKEVSKVMHLIVSHFCMVWLNESRTSDTLIFSYVKKLSSDRQYLEEFLVFGVNLVPNLTLS